MKVLYIMFLVLGAIGIWLVSSPREIEPYVFNNYYTNASDSPINSTSPDIWFWRASWEKVSQHDCSYDEYNIVEYCNTTYIPMIHIKALTNNKTLAKELGCVICHDADFDVSCPQVSEDNSPKFFAGIFILGIVYLTNHRMYFDYAAIQLR